MDSKLYRVLRPIIKFLVKVFIRPKFIGLENIDDEALILAGNHTSILDCLLLISATNRSVHFLAKDSLWKGPKKILFGNLGLIPVNRKSRSHKSLEMAEEYLKGGHVVGIFPEGTTEKGRGLLPFKIGAFKMAKDTNAKIIPFVIRGKYRLFSKNLKIKFGEKFIVEGDLEDEKKSFRNVIIKLMED